MSRNRDSSSGDNASVDIPLVDAHCHFADTRFSNEMIDNLISSSQKMGIQFFLQGGVDPKDWNRQLEMSQKYPGLIGTCFGLHPYFVAQSTHDECEMAMDELAKKLHLAIAVGEMGLDFRSQYISSPEVRDQQIEFFDAQMRLATLAQKPVVLHIVRAHEEALKCLRVWDLPRLSSGMPGIVHAFNGSLKVAAQYMELGFLISVGGAVTHPRNQDLREAVKGLPLTSLLIESDSPDQRPFGWQNELNSSSSIFNVAQAISNLRGDMQPQELLECAANNFTKLGFSYTRA